MYIYLLWLRYLRTRRLAFICMGSVMLGVATLIVVNSVMAGFSSKMTQKLHEMQSDIVIEPIDQVGGLTMPAEEMMERIKRSSAGEHIVAMAPSIEIFAMMQVRYPRGTSSSIIRLIGIDPKYQKDFPGFSDGFLDEERRRNPSFDIDPAAVKRFEFFHPPLPPDPVLQIPPAAPPPADQLQLAPLSDPSKKPLKRIEDLPPIDAPPVVPRKLHAAIVGHAMACFRDIDNNGESFDHYILERGDGVTIMTLGAALEPVTSEFVVCDYVKTGMSDVDSQIVYVPLDYLQHLRTMEGRCSTLQIRVKDQAMLNKLKDQLQMLFPTSDGYIVKTWQDKQGSLLAAISIERGILNLLLFMIIGVAGFGILAIFSMIVTEKTRDIGILKSLGASAHGIMSIFLGYGLLLGAIGSAMGTGLGLLITYNINGIEQWISRNTGHELFDRKIYYFSEIPVDVQWTHLASVCAGAVLIAVVFSILPALKASWLRPVQALRYE